MDQVIKVFLMVLGIPMMLILGVVLYFIVYRMYAFRCLIIRKHGIQMVRMRKIRGQDALRYKKEVYHYSPEDVMKTGRFSFGCVFYERNFMAVKLPRNELEKLSQTSIPSKIFAHFVLEKLITELFENHKLNNIITWSLIGLAILIGFYNAWKLGEIDTVIMQINATVSSAGYGG